MRTATRYSIPVPAFGFFSVRNCSKISLRGLRLSGLITRPDDAGMSGRASSGLLNQEGVLRRASEIAIVTLHRALNGLQFSGSERTPEFSPLWGPSVTDVAPRPRNLSNIQPMTFCTSSFEALPCWTRSSREIDLGLGSLSRRNEGRYCGARHRKPSARCSGRAPSAEPSEASPTAGRPCAASRWLLGSVPHLVWPAFERRQPHAFGAPPCDPHRGPLTALVFRRSHGVLLERPYGHNSGRFGKVDGELCRPVSMPGFLAVRFVASFVAEQW